jgi:hypothetical protein
MKPAASCERAPALKAKTTGYRSRLLEVTVVSHSSSKWEWQVSDGGDFVTCGFERTRVMAKHEGDGAMFPFACRGLVSERTAPDVCSKLNTVGPTSKRFHQKPEFENRFAGRVRDFQLPTRGGAKVLNDVAA